MKLEMKQTLKQKPRKFEPVQPRGDQEYRIKNSELNVIREVLTLVENIPLGDFCQCEEIRSKTAKAKSILNKVKGVK